MTGLRFVTAPKTSNITAIHALARALIHVHSSAPISKYLVRGYYKLLGHKDIENTRLYISLEKNLFKNLNDDKFIIKSISTVGEAVKLRVGFEPFMVISGIQLMRKREIRSRRRKCY